MEAKKGHWARLGEGVLDFTGEHKIWKMPESSGFPKESCHQVWTILNERSVVQPTELVGVRIWRELWHQTWRSKWQFGQLDPAFPHFAPFSSFWNITVHPMPLYIWTMWPVFYFLYRGDAAKRFPWVSEDTVNFELTRCWLVDYGNFQSWAQCRLYYDIGTIL